MNLVCGCRGRLLQLLNDCGIRMEELVENNTKLESFYELAKALNKVIGVVPILYGSLGLSKALDIDIQTDDIDLLLEDTVFKTRLAEVQDLMYSLGFTLIVPDEHEFQRDSLKIGIASDGDLLSYSGIDPRSLEIVSARATYRILSPIQYLATYKASSLDGYRKDIRQKDDDAKIRLIESVLFA